MGLSCDLARGREVRAAGGAPVTALVAVSATLGLIVSLIVILTAQNVLSPQAFAKRMRVHQGLQLGNDRRVLAQRVGQPQHREHAMPYFYEGVELTRQSRTLETGISPRGYNIALLHHTTDFGDYRWTVDTPEDLEFMREVYSRFDGRDDFS
jgi:hypothetical protein